MNMDMPHYQFDAYSAHEQLRERYAAFLLDHFGIRAGAPNNLRPLARVLTEHWKGSGSGAFNLFAPLIVQGAFPFEPGNPLASLGAGPGHSASEPALHPHTIELFEKAGFTFPLFKHQVETIRAATEGKTVILSAGTGSGKTESFLIPLINRLYQDHADGRDDLTQAGIRAIIIYPLNALVNNQVDRLRKILMKQLDFADQRPRLTFAYYTSRLKDKESTAIRYLEKCGKSKAEIERLKAIEIMDRQTLRGLSKSEAGLLGPPHILVTNFSMLEYMLIRPVDRSIFLPERLFYRDQPRLKAVVLDEAHVYAGAQAAEIHMLLRRTATRFQTQLDQLQGFATSATLSGGAAGEGAASLKVFAQQMFAKESGQVAVIEGHRHLPAFDRPELMRRPLASLEALPSREKPLIPAQLHTLEFDAEGRPVGLLRSPELVILALEACQQLGLADTSDLSLVPAPERDCPALVLYHLLSGNATLRTLRQWLFNREKEQNLPSLIEVARQLYSTGEEAAACRATEAILRLASLARRQPEELPLIPVRMHAFVRTPAGVWVNPAREEGEGIPEADWHWGKLSSRPPESSDTLPWLQLYLCPTCGFSYLSAWRKPATQQYVASPDPGLEQVAFYADPASDDRLPDEWGGAHIRAIRVEREGWEIKLQEACPHCRQGRDPLKRLRLDVRVVIGIITDCLYPHLGEVPRTPETASRFLPGGGRRLLTFSDSRQGAAEVATRVETTHDIGVNRQNIWRVLLREQHRERGDVSFEDLMNALLTSPGLKQRFAASRARSNKEAMEDLATVCLYEEFGRPPAFGNTLESLGLVEVVYPQLPARPAAMSFFSEEEWHDYLSQILDDLRRRGTVRKPQLDSEQEKDIEQLLPVNLIDKTLVWSLAEIKSDVGADENEDEGDSVPFRSERGKRRIFHYTAHLLQSMKVQKKPEEVLEIVWKTLLDAAENRTCRWLIQTEYGRSMTKALKIHLGKLKFRALETPGWIDDITGRVYFRSVRDVSPDVTAELGSCLRKLTPEDAAEWNARHAIRRVKEDPLLGLWSIEHTAQIEVDDLERAESRFKTGELNLLASSTTMEMGVDLGGLTLVLMTNVPPGPSNYWQRAGRAGRRADGSSMVLTLVQPRPHDQRVFEQPARLLHQSMLPPTLRLDTVPLIQRQLNAFLLGRFFEETLATGPGGNPMNAFGTVGDFIFAPVQSQTQLVPAAQEKLHLDSSDSLADGAIYWLLSLSEDHVSPSTYKAIPKLIKGTELEAYTPEELAYNCAEMLEHVVEKARHDMRRLEQEKVEAEKEGAGKLDRDLLYALKCQKEDLTLETVIAYLVQGGVLPRFGFPVDLVQLNARWKKSERGRSGIPREEPLHSHLRLERPLDMALSEYTPGAELVADKLVFRTAGLIPNWSSARAAYSRRYYLRCAQCGHLEDRPAKISECSLCGHPAQRDRDFIREKTMAKGKAGKKRAKREAIEVAPTAGVTGSADISTARHYLEPRGFSVKYGIRPKRLSGILKRGVPADRQVYVAHEERLQEVIPGLLTVGYAPDSKLFIRSEGRREDDRAGEGLGYRICRLCGYTEPEAQWASDLEPEDGEATDGRPALPKSFRNHRRLRGLDDCPMTSEYWRHAVLGTSILVDAFRVRFTGALAPDFDPPRDQQTFYQLFAMCLLEQAAEELQIDSRQLTATIAPYRVQEPKAQASHKFQYEAVLYETSCSGMLKLVHDQALKLIRKTVAALAEQGDAEYIRFSNQYIFQGEKPQLKLIRDHFAQPHRIALLSKGTFLEEAGARLLRGRSPRIAALELFDGATNRLLIQGPALSPQAFERDGLMRALNIRLLSSRLEKGSYTRMMLNRLPNPASSDEQEAILVGRLRQLLHEGLELRQVAKADLEAVVASPWRVISRGIHGYAALGAMLGEPDQSTGIGNDSAILGPGWIPKAVPVEANPDTAKQALEMAEATWQRAAPIRAEDLIKTSDVIFITVSSKRVKNPAEAWNIFFGGQAGPGSPRSWGQVIELEYRDGYVAANAVALWMLDHLLELFNFSADAKATVSFDAKWRRNVPDREEINLDGSKPPSGLLEVESEKLRQGLVTKYALTGLQLAFREESHLPHARRMRLRFSAGSKWQSLVILFDQGLDWVRPESDGNSRWKNWPVRLQESHAVLLPNK